MTAAAEDYVFDLTYVDCPYNQHSYRSNYHIWETLVLWDKPETYGIAKKRVDCRTLKSPYNSKKTALPALEAVVAAVRSRYVLLSFNNEGFIPLEEMTAMLGKYGKLDVFEVDHKRHIGSAIGIHNLHGEKVGTPGAKKNLEYFYLLEKA
jgi:adenine-specific DNA-methyltransferase